MHIRRSFSARLFGQSLKRIGTALKEVAAGQTDPIGATNLPAELHALVQTRDPISTTPLTEQSERRDQLQRMALLTRLAIELRAALDSATIAHNVLAAIGLHGNVDMASIVLVGPNDTIELALSNSAGQPQPMPPEETRQLLERGPAGWDWRDSSSVLLANDAQALGWESASHALRSGSVMALPLSHGQTTFGLLTLSHQVPNHFTSQDLLLFEGVAAQAGVALSAAGSIQAARQQRGQRLPEQELQITHNREPMHTIFDHLPDGLVLLDATGHILIANDAFCEDVLGMLPRAAIGRQYTTIIQELEQSAQITIEPHPSIPTVRRAHCDGGDGRRRWYDIDRYGVAADDNADQVIERWRDITRQEEQQLALLHDEQLTTMSRLAANVVHEIGNPLQSVRSCIDLSREDRTLTPTTAEYLELASSELRRMSQILSQLRDLYRLPLNEANNE
ncbi:MAG: histidine kinase dimerization/phospho-acceptor domain-containing protein [Roseiflexaceae bacterium]